MTEQFIAFVTMMDGAFFPVVMTDTENTIDNEQVYSFEVDEIVALAVLREDGWVQIA